MKLINALLKVKNCISNAMFILMSVNIKVFLKNRDFSTLLLIIKGAINIPNILSLEPLIF